MERGEFEPEKVVGPETADLEKEGLDVSVDPFHSAVDHLREGLAQTSLGVIAWRK